MTARLSGQLNNYGESWVDHLHVYEFLFGVSLPLPDYLSLGYALSYYERNSLRTRSVAFKSGRKAAQVIQRIKKVKVGA
jgi:hypothetical protein